MEVVLLNKVDNIIFTQFIHPRMNDTYPQVEIGRDINSLALFYLYTKKTCHLNKRMGTEGALL